MSDLSQDFAREELANKIKAAIDAASVEIYSEGPRSHLGGSVIGEPCSRKLYYGFRWCYAEAKSGRMLRLFNVGNREEPKFIEYLRHAGFTVREVDPTNGKQFRISGCNGHFGGSQDGEALPPPAWEIDQWMLCEFKTYNTKGFIKLVETGSVALHSPKYYAQICTYGRKRGYKHCIFLATNKNDNDIYCEIVPINEPYAEGLEVKAHEVIFAKQPPPRISENPADFDCSYCDAKDVCHYGKPVEVNCRSCQHSAPVENAEWYCHLHKGVIPKDFQSKGCPQHQGIVSS